MTEYSNFSAIVTLIILSFAYAANNSYAFSPSFPSTQIVDPTGDTSSSVFPTRDGCRLNSKFSQDMSGVTYTSDGTYLNSTIWLKNPIKSIINPLSANRTVVVIYPFYPNNTIVNVAHGQKKDIQRYLADFNSSITPISHKQIFDSNNKSFDVYNYSYHYPLDVPHKNAFKRYGFKIISDSNNNESSITTYESNSNKAINKIIADIKEDPNSYSFRNHNEYINDTLAKSSPVDYDLYKKYNVKTSSDYTQPIILKVVSWKSSQYTVEVSIISPYDITPDYLQSIIWRNETKKWEQTTSQLSPDSTEATILRSVPIDARYIFKEGTGELTNNTSVNLALNLSSINFPLSYELLFLINNEFTIQNPISPKKTFLCSVTDMSDLVVAPPPKIQIYAKPSTVVLQSGQPQHIDVIVNSSTDLASAVSFTIQNKTGLNSEINPSRVSLSPHGVATASLKLSGSSSNVTSVSLPIAAHVTFPATFINKISALTMNTTNLTGITLQAYPLITLMPPKPIGEQISEIFSAFSFTIQNVGGIITTIGTISGGIIALLAIFNRTKKKKKGQKNKQR